MSDSEFDDDAPVAVSLKQSKVEHENLDNQIRDFLKDRRTAIKDKRRVKNDTLKKQKEAKQKKVTDKDESVQSAEMTAQQKYQHQKRFLPTAVVNSLTDSPAAKDSPNKNINFAERSDGNSSEEEADVSLPVRVKPKRMKRKIYEKFNIRVEALGQLENKRTAAALDFRSRRMGKVHRESVDQLRIYKEKLAASGQDRLRKKL